jgi:hypothetical protein
MKPAVRKAGMTLAVLAAAALAPQVLAGHLNIVLEAKLDGRQEVATGSTNQRIVGDPRGRGEGYVFGVDGDRNTICYIVRVEGIGELHEAPGNGRMAHIHRGARGSNGPVVVTIAWPQDGRSADCISESRILPNGAPAFARDPATGAPLATATEVLTNPEGFYINVHNAEYPGGAVRGQLRDTLDTDR